MQTLANHSVDLFGKNTPVTFFCILKGSVLLCLASMENTSNRLRSAMWSSETLVKGVQAIQKQGHDMMTLAKDEEDEELVNEYNVP